MMKPYLAPVSFLYKNVMALRNQFYDSGFFKVENFNIPIVSVGNLTLGGAGKTPVICELLKWSLENGIRPAMVSRGYKRQSRGVVKVPNGADAAIYGDEPAMVARRFPNVPIYLGERRVEAVKEMLLHEDVQVIFADDAFQHRQLGRALDVVVIDCTEKIENYAVVPQGRSREDKNGLCRAQFIVLNKVNLVSPEQKKEVLDFIDVTCREGVPVIESEYYIGRYIRLADGEVLVPQGYEKAILISGIGNPEAFASLLNKSFDVKRHFAFRDHHVFTREEIRRIENSCQEFGAQKIVVTEKDAVKMTGLFSAPEKVWVAELSPKLSIRVKALYESILNELR